MVAKNSRQLKRWPLLDFHSRCVGLGWKFEDKPVRWFETSLSLRDAGVAATLHYESIWS
jgi:hypothetical protein